MLKFTVDPGIKEIGQLNNSTRLTVVYLQGQRTKVELKADLYPTLSQSK